MATDGKVVLTDSGKRGLLSSGKVAIFDDSDECAECCEDCSDDPCADCVDGMYNWYANDPVVTGDLNLTLDFSYTSTWECDCFWCFNWYNDDYPGDPESAYMQINWDDTYDEYCAWFLYTDSDSNVTEYGVDDCTVCGGQNVELCCHADTEAFTAVYTLDEVGGSGSITVTITQ